MHENVRYGKPEENGSQAATERCARRSLDSLHHLAEPRVRGLGGAHGACDPDCTSPGFFHRLHAPLWKC